jgi:hypothetical protein
MIMGRDGRIYKTTGGKRHNFLKVGRFERLVRSLDRLRRARLRVIHKAHCGVVVPILG